MAHDNASHRSNFLVFAAVMALAATSYGISFASLGAVRVPVAIAISVLKASLVVGVFMDLIRQRSTNRFVLAAALIVVSTLIGLMAADTLTRDTPPLEPASARVK